MQRLSKRIQAEWLHVVLKVGIGLLWIRLNKRPQLTRRHAHGARALQGIL